MTSIIAGTSETTVEEARRELRKVGPISPELVLVSPDLAPIARQALEPPGVETERKRVATSLSKPLPPPVFALPDGGRLAEPTVRRRRLPRRVVRRAAIGAALLAFAGVAGWLAAVYWLRQPSVETVARPRATSFAAPATTSRPRPARATAGRTATTSHAAAGRTATPPAKPSRRSRKTRVRGAARAGRRFATPNAGFIFPGGGRFQIGRRGRTVVNFVIGRGCGSGLSVPAMRITRHGRFAFHGRARGGGATARVDLDGIFVRRTLARVTLRVRAKGCTSGLERFAARLS